MEGKGRKKKTAKRRRKLKGRGKERERTPVCIFKHFYNSLFPENVAEIRFIHISKPEVLPNSAEK